MSQLELDYVNTVGIKQALVVVDNASVFEKYNVKTNTYHFRSKQLVFNKDELDVQNIFFSCCSLYLDINRPLKYLERRNLITKELVTEMRKANV